MRKSVTTRGKKRSGEETRQRILAAACDVFGAAGYGGASIREVARRAGISVGCVYLYFPNKQELYLGLMKSQMDEFLGRLESLRAEAPLAAIRAVIASYLQVAVTRTKMLSASIKEYDLEFKRPLRNAFFRSQRRLVADILKRGVRDGVFRPMDCDEVALVLVTSLRGAILGYLTVDITKPKVYADTFFETFLNGIRSPHHDS